MKKIKLVAFLILFLSATLSVVAQDRQVALEVELPAKRSLVTSDIALGGKVFLPVGNFTVVGDLNFRDAANLFIAPTDQITAEGQVWYYLTGREGKAKPFVFGGITHAMFIGEPVDSTAGLAGFGLAFKTARGSYIIPTFQFSSDDLQEDRTVLGKAYSAKVYIQVALSPNFNLNLTPTFERRQDPALDYTHYGNVYLVKIGFSRKF
jgi:hypothetical protein